MINVIDLYSSVFCSQIYINQWRDMNLAATTYSICFYVQVYVWYYGGYVRITVIHRDFLKATKCNFCKITVDQHDSDKFTVIPT
jgi:hypothetical protein